MRASPLEISQFDVSHCSQLIALVRYVDHGIMKENFLFCAEMKTTTKTKVLQLAKDFFSKQELDIQSIVSMYTGGALAMREINMGFLH